MRRTYGFGCLIAAVFAFSGVVWWGSRGGAEPPKVSPTNQPANPALPLTQVILFNSGVGYLQREGTVQGTARIDMTFALKDMNDLLKSVVLEDRDGGKVSAVSYEGQEPVENTLRSFALDLTNNPTFAQLLNQARGEKVEVKTSGGTSLPAALTGSIVGLETQPDGAKQLVFLNLHTADGVRNIPLAAVQSFRFLNPAVERDFRQALDVLARTHDSEKKQVSFSFVGDGKRAVKVGYVVESPMWKANYRLVMGKEGRLKLQGWAVVENTSDDDWNEVRLALVVARPISFTMDQYQPLFVPRPAVEPELFALLRPPVISAPVGGIGGGLGGIGGIGGGLGGIGGIGQPGQIGQQGPGGSQPLLQIDPTTGLLVPPPQFRSGVSFEELQERRRQLDAERGKARQLGNAIADFKLKDAIEGLPFAEGGAMEDSFQYVIDQKVTIPRQKSALLPILNEEVMGQHVSIFNERNNGRFPLLGVRFKNVTKKPLMQGPVMVYDDGKYAGDARLLNVPPDEERMLAYGVDLGTEVKVVEPEAVGGFVKATPGATADVMPDGSVVAHWPTAVKVVKGYLTVTNMDRATKALLLRNRSREDRVVIVEHPVDGGWKLVSPKPIEASHDYYRFEVPVAAGKSVRCELVRERVRNEQLSVTAALGHDWLQFFLDGKLASPAVKAAMLKILERRAAVKTFEDEGEILAGQLQAAQEEQAAVRASINRVPKDAEVYKRYLARFDEQETQIEKFQAQLKEKQRIIRQKQQECAEYLQGLNVE